MYQVLGLLEVVECHLFRETPVSCKPAPRQMFVSYLFQQAQLIVQDVIFKNHVAGCASRMHGKENDREFTFPLSAGKPCSEANVKKRRKVVVGSFSCQASQKAN